MNERIYSFIGLAMKAGELVSGEEACERAIKKNKVKLIIVAEDSSEKSKKNYRDMCDYRNIRIEFFGEKEKLGKSIGKETRAVIAIIEKGFAKRLSELIEGKDTQNGGK